MNYALCAYLICLLIMAAILAQPIMHIIPLQIHSLEKIKAIDYWLVANALIHAYDKPDPKAEFKSFLEAELNTLNPKIIEIPEYTILNLNITSSHVEAKVLFKHSWTTITIHVYLHAEITSKNVRFDPNRNAIIISANVKVHSDWPIHINFDAINGEILSVEGFIDQNFEVKIASNPSSNVKLLIRDSRGLCVVIVIG